MSWTRKKVSGIQKKFKPSPVKQEFRDAADVNLVMKKCIRTGMPLPGPVTQGVYMDCVGMGDFREVVTRIANARTAFEKLPSAIRKRFRNDPASLVEFLQNDANREEAVKLGLLPKKEEQPNAEPAPAPVAPSEGEGGAAAGTAGAT